MSGRDAGVFEERGPKRRPAPCIMMGRMLTQLTFPNFQRLESLYEPLHHHLALRALLAGVVPGQVYADDPEQPTLALAWVQQRLFLAGWPKTTRLPGALLDDIGQAAQRRGLRYLVLHYAPAGWAEALEGELAALKPQRAARHYYAFRAPRHAWRKLLPAGYALRTVDRELLAEPGLGHVALLKAEMCSERPTVEAFCQHSFGVCVVRDNALAGWCLSEYNHAGACEVGIETLPDHRGQRLATVMASVLSDRATANGITCIGWHCYARNAASVATALAAGFEKVTEYPVIILDFATTARGA